VRGKLTGHGPTLPAQIRQDRQHPERDPIYARQKEIAANFADYEKSAAPRVIPVILLDPVA
jgi:hypothetical protein